MTTGHAPTQENLQLAEVGKLGRLLNETSESVVYEVEPHQSGAPAIVEIRRADAEDASRQLTRWRQSIELPHPNLLRLYTAGQSVLDGIPVIYLVSERAEESLAAVLEDRALSEEETREMLGPVLSALAYLHRRGYAHTSLVPEHIFAVGDTLKLSSSAIQRDDHGSIHDDIRAVGVLVVQALTQKTPEVEPESGPYIFREASEPLSAIVRHCLDPDRDKRWTAEQALAQLAPGSTALPPSTPHADPLPIAQPRAHSPSTSHTKWLYASAAAAVLIAAAALGLTGKKVAAPASVEPVKIQPVASQPSPPVVAPPLPRPHGPRTAGWAVVVASYAARGPAETRAREFAKKWPKFHAEVFQPASQQTRHLVVIGKDLPQSKAEALKKRARAFGLPKDTYIKRFD